MSNRLGRVAAACALLLFHADTVSAFFAPVAQRRVATRTCTPLALSPSDEPASMRASQIKDELRERNMDFSDCFDKESLVEKLVHARAGPASPPAAAAATRDPSPPAAAHDEDPELARIRFIVMRMRASQIKDELRKRDIGFADCFDKESLADKLVQARMGLISPPPPPPPPPTPPPAAPPRGAANGGFEYGFESRQDEDMSMEEAFRAAGWTGEKDKKPAQVDTARSPGLQRNFGDVDVADFKKPYSGGGPGKKSRYG